MSRFNGRSLLRGQVRVNRGGYVEDNPAPEQEKVTLMGLDALDGAKNAATIVKPLGFECYCKIDSRTGIASFFAQIDGGKSWSFTPVMPKDIMGNVLEQPNVYNGARGYLVLRISVNAKTEENSRGQRSLTVRPEFIAFAETAEAAKAKAAEVQQPPAKK